MKKLFFFLAAVAVALTASAKVTTISPDAENDALRLAVHDAEDGDIIEMTEGTYVQCNNSYVAFDGKSVTVRAAEGANVVLQLQVPITIANGGKATLQGIKIDASRLTELANWYEHIIYPTDATEGKELVMEGCELYGFNLNKSAIYSAATNTLALCTINNSYFHDNMKSCFFFEGTSIGELSITNSTFAHIATDASGYYAGIIDVRNADAKVTIDHCTFFDCKVMNNDYAAITMKGPQAANVVISNNIFAFLEATDGHRAIRENVEAKNCLTFNYIKDNGGIYSSVTKTDCLLNTDPLFIDAANGNYGMFANSPAATASTTGGQIGDPRWKVSAAERRRIEITPTSPEAADNLRIALLTAEDGDTIVMAAGTYLESNSNYIAFDGKTVVVMAAEDAEVILQPQVPITIANGGKATFIGVKIDASHLQDNSTYSHLIYPSDATTGKELVLEGCELYNFNINSSAIHSSSTNELELCKINNCYFHDNMKSCLFFEGPSIGELSITNSTFAHIATDASIYYAGVIDVRNENAEVNVDYCTFYNCEAINSDYGAIKVTCKTLVSNSIFVAPEPQNTYSAIYAPDDTNAEAKNCLTFNYGTSENGIQSAVTQTECIVGDPLFVDAANGDYGMFANSPAATASTTNGQIGDPRWKVSAAERRRIEITPTSPEAADNLRIALLTAEDGDTIVMAAGTYLESNSNYIAFDGKTVVVMAAEDAEVILQPQVPITISNGGKATFIGIKIDASRLTELEDEYEHVIYPTDATEGKELIMDGCELYGFNINKSAIYSSSSNTLALCDVKNCYFHDNMKSCFFFEGASIAELSVANSTFANIATDATGYYAGIIDVRSTAAKVTVDHCTFYNCLLMNTDYAAITMKGPQKANVTISNNIFMLPEAIDGHRAIRQDVGAANCMTFNYVKDNGGIHSSVAQTSCFLNTDPLFVDAANNNFKLKANSPAIGKATDGTNLGDPRWGVEEPTLITLTTGDNSQVITDNIGKTVNVKIARSFKANDGYYTLCVPFNMPASVIGTVYEIDGIEAYTAGQDGGLSINLDPVTNLLAGVPYLVEPKENMNELVVEGVIIANDKPSEDYSWNNGMVKLSFQGCYSADGKTDGATEYYIGNGGYLYNNVVDKRGLCGFLTITDNDDNPVNIRARVVTREEVETGLDNNQLPNINIQKVLENGQLIIIRDGVKYNVQGQKL